MRLPRFVRVAVMAGLSGVLAVTLALVPTSHDTEAVAAIVPPTPPPALTVLPSTVKGVLTGVASANANALATLLYKFSKTDTFWKAAAAVQAGSASTTQTQLVAAQTATYKTPAFKLGNLTKVVGGVSSVLTSFQLGAMIGGSVVEVMGIDTAGLICGKTGPAEGFLGYVTGADCSAIQARDDYLANFELKDRYTNMCTAYGAALTGTAAIPGVSCGGGYQSVNDLRTNVYGVQVAQLTSTTFRVTQTLITPKPATQIGTNNVSLRVICYTSGGLYSSLKQTLTNNQPATAVTAGTTQTWDITNTCTGSRMAIEAYSDGTATTARSFGIIWRNDSMTVPQVQLVDQDPDRVIRCVILGTNSATYTGDSRVFKESSGVTPSPNCPTLPAGVSPAKIDILTCGGDAGCLTLYSETPTPEYQSQTTLAPECANGTCMLDLRVGTVSCFVSPSTCVGWFADPLRDTKYTCFYGTHAVAISECYVYAPSFETASPGEYADPDTGEILPSPSPGAIPVDGETFGDPVKDPATERQCFPTGWGVLNPVEWVMKPVVCAIQWAFVPRASVIASYETQWTAALDASILAQVGAITSSLVSSFDVEGAGCMGPPFRVQFTSGPLFGSGGMDETYYPLAACDEPMSGFASVMNAITSGVVIVAAQLASIRYVAAVVGYSGLGSRVTYDGGASGSANPVATAGRR